MGKPIIDIIVDVETIGIFRPGFIPSRKYEKELISSMQEGKKLTKEQEKEKEKKMIISNAVFNVGITVQHNGDIKEQHQVGIDEFWLYPEHRIMDFYRKTFDKEGKDFTIRYETFGEFLVKCFYPLLKKCGENGKSKIKLHSYNASFDRRAFIDTAKLEGMIIPESIQNNWNCIMIQACNTLLKDNGRKYFNWIIKNEYDLINKPKHERGEYLTFGRNARITAETMYRYISKDLSFIEAHKGLQDTEIEGKILQWCKKNGGAKVNAEPIDGGWKELNHYAVPFHRRGMFDNKEVREDILSPINQEKLYSILESRGDERDWM